MSILTDRSKLLKVVYLTAGVGTVVVLSAIAWDWFIREQPDLPDKVTTSIRTIQVCPSRMDDLESYKTAALMWSKHGWQVPEVVPALSCGEQPMKGFAQIRACGDFARTFEAGCIEGNFDTVEFELPNRARAVAYLPDDAPKGAAVHVVGHLLGLRDNKKGMSPMYYKGPWTFLDFDGVKRSDYP